MTDAKKKNTAAKSKQQTSSKKSRKVKKSENMNSISLTETNKKFKVRLPIKIAVLSFSVLALSCFFEGWRQIHNSLNVPHVLLFAFGILSTAILLWLQAFWIYMEEKSKGTLRRTIKHFDKLEEYLQRRKQS